MILRSPRSTLFPYTTLFRSWGPGRAEPSPSCSARRRAATSGGRRSGVTGARKDLARACEMGRVHHLALEREGIDTASAGLGERRDELARLVHHGDVRSERGVDHGDLAGMDGDLAGESHVDRVLALTAEAVEVGDVGVDGIERLDPGGRRGDRAHDPGVAGDVEVLPGGTARAADAPGP